jgi:hypothetical protein
MAGYWSVAEAGYKFSEETGPKADWVVISNELETLYYEEKADKVEGGYLVKHEIAASFDADERELLQLPEVFPYYISIKTLRGNLARNDFRYLIEYLKPDGTPFINPKVIQSYIELNSDLSYMFNESQYELVKLAKDCNNEVAKITDKTEILEHNFTNLAEIQQLGHNCEAHFERILAKTKVVKPDKLSITARRIADGSIIVEPVLLKKYKKADSDEYEYKEIYSPEFVEAYNNAQDVQGTYLGKEGTKFVFNKPLREGLKVVKQHGKLTEEQYRRCVLQPKEIFSADIFEFNDSYYAERVKGIGDFVHTPLPYMRPESEGWLPEEGTGEGGNDPNIDLINQDNVEEINKKIDDAKIEGKDEIVYQGKVIPLTPSFVVRTKNILNETYEPDNVENQPKSNDTSEAEKQKVLLIKDNFDSLGYTALKNAIIKNKNVLKIDCGLNDDVVLFDHQKNGITWMCNTLINGDHGVLLADDMGLGKTLQTLAFLAWVKANIGDECNSVLVVAPVALLNNWQEEYRTFIRPGIFDDIVLIRSSNIAQYKNNTGAIDFKGLDKNKIIITTYETIRHYQVSFGLINWSIIVLDEAQKIKTPNVMVTQAVKAMKYAFAVCLTGTPVENSWIDLWSIMDFVSPGKLKTLKEFSGYYQKQLIELKDDEIGLEKLGKELKKAIDPLFLRRLKKDCLGDLPTKDVVKCAQIMPPVQKKAYESVIAMAKDAKKNLNKKNALEIIAMLRDVSLYPDLANFSPYAYAKEDCSNIINQSARLKKTFEILFNIYQKGEKALIFVISRKMQALLRLLIERVFSIKVPTPINGELLGERRQELVDAFNSSQGFAVLILSPEAGGVGFNITSANHVIHLSRCWNPAKEDQATDRVYRIGQNKPVHVYIPMAVHPVFGENGSFDEKLDKLLDYKRELSDNVLFPTSDSDMDGLKLFGELTTIPGEEIPTNYWSIDDIKKVTGTTFEKIICALFKKMQYTAHTTAQSNDNGADVVVLYDKVNHKGYLVQCKQTTTDKNMNPDGVEEVVSSIKYYEKFYTPFTFTGIVVTNAPGFTANATERARVNGVELWSRDKLKAMIEKYPVEKFYN